MVITSRSVYTDPGDRDLLPNERLLGVGRPQVGRCDNDALGEGSSTRRSEKRIDVFLSQGRCWCVVLALDRGEPAVSVLCDEVDTDVGFANRTVGPIHPQPDVGELFGVGAVRLERRPHEDLEPVALVAFAAGSIPYRFKDCGNWHGTSCPRVSERSPEARVLMCSGANDPSFDPFPSSASLEIRNLEIGLAACVRADSAQTPQTVVLVRDVQRAPLK